MRDMNVQHQSISWQQLLQQMQQSQVFHEIAVSGIGVACGTTVTNPIDVVKTRLQLQQAPAADAPKPGLVSTAVHVVRHEGMAALWKGWVPAVARAIFYGGLRLGLYNPIQTAIATAESGRHSSSSSMSSGMSTKLLAGITSGSIAAALLSPTELVKVRLQAPGSPYSSSSAAIAAVVSADGVTGLWKGATPGVVRAAVLTASQCVTYDEVKQQVLAATGWQDAALTHLATAMITGIVSTTATNPVDVVKTHMFVGGRQHAGPLACAASLYAAHGLGAFTRGWSANYARLGPQTVVTFMVVEQLRLTLGMTPLGK